MSRIERHPCRIALAGIWHVHSWSCSWRCRQRFGSSLIKWILKSSAIKSLKHGLDQQAILWVLERVAGLQAILDKKDGLVCCSERVHSVMPKEDRLASIRCRELKWLHCRAKSDLRPLKRLHRSDWNPVDVSHFGDHFPPSHHGSGDLEFPLSVRFARQMLCKRDIHRRRPASSVTPPTVRSVSWCDWQ